MNYLERVYYEPMEFLEAADFIAEQQYFRDQFLELYTYYFTPGIAGAPQYLPAQGNGDPPSQPTSFFLEPEADKQGLTVGPGLGMNSKAEQIVLLSPVYIGGELLYTRGLGTFDLTIAFKTETDKKAKRIYMEPKFQIFPNGEPPVRLAPEQTVDPPVRTVDDLYLATFTVVQVTPDPPEPAYLEVTDLVIDQSLRQYSVPWGEAIPPEAAEKLAEANQDRIAELDERVARLEAQMKDATKPENKRTPGPKRAR